VTLRWVRNRQGHDDRIGLDADATEMEGRVHRRVLKSCRTYVTTWGEVEVERWLYNNHTHPTVHALVALDLRLRIVESVWMQRASEQASWVVPQKT
jgi:hypothetical protein